jgi:hypothetical protein
MPNNQEFYCMAPDCAFLQTEPGKAQFKGNDGKLQSVEVPLLARKLGGGKYEYVKLQKTEGFILQLLLQQLEYSLVKQALMNESSGLLNDQGAEAMIDHVIAQYTEEKFIQPLGTSPQQTVEKIKNLRIQKKEIQDLDKRVKARQRNADKGEFPKLHLDASINQIGPIVIKFTFPPLR